MIQKTVRYEQMNQIHHLLQTLQAPLEQLKQSPTTSAPTWDAIEDTLGQIERCGCQLQKAPFLKKEDYSISDWESWEAFVQETKQLHQQTLQELIEAKEIFYHAVRQVGQSVKAHQAYNNMKRIRL